MGVSKFLSGLSSSDRQSLVAELLEQQHELCFICDGVLDPVLHEVDVDHVVPLAQHGLDDPSNFAAAHANCNRSKQASDLRIARVLATFARIDAGVSADRSADLGDVLGHFGGAKSDWQFVDQGDHLRFSLSAAGDDEVRSIPVWKDPLSKIRYCFANLPIEYLHHDGMINPRPINKNLRGLIEEFHAGRPQLHVALAWISSLGAGPVNVFDGQHKAAAQILLGARSLPVRIFLDPDMPTLLKTNTNAGTVLRQVAFDKSVQRRLGSSLFRDRVERYRQENGLALDDGSFSEQTLVSYFAGEQAEMKRYVLDSVRTAVISHTENRLMQYVELGGRTSDRPLSYGSVDKTFLSIFIGSSMLETPIDWLVEEQRNPRDCEIDQLVRLMNIVAEVVLSEFDAKLGTAKIEDKVQKNDDVPDGHLRSFRMTREPVLAAWLRYVPEIINHYSINATGKPINRDRIFQEPLPEALWMNIERAIRKLHAKAFWVSHPLSSTVFAGKPTGDYWTTILNTGSSPQGAKVFPGGINLLELITE